MTHTYNITGMTCKNCVARVKSRLLMIAGISAAEVQLEAPQATVTMQKHIQLHELQAAIKKAGNYTITDSGEGMMHAANISWVKTYKPVLLIFGYLTGISLLLQVTRGSFNLVTWMQHFMAGFFLVFSFFKLLDLKGFADSYAMYDMVAKKWYGWGLIYPFAELALGIAYLIVPADPITSIIMLAIMLVGIAGVMQSLLNKRRIQCACLGAVFNLPMSTVTIIEDGLMIGMGVVMLLTMT